MPFDSGGNFTRVHDFEADRDNGIKIMASRVDAEFDNFANGMNVVFFRNGLVPMTGDLNMGLNSILNLSSGSAAIPSLRFGADAGSGLMLDGAGKPTLVSGTNKRIAATSAGADITGTLTVSSTAAFTGKTTHTGGIDSDGNLVFTNASTRNIMFGAAGVDGRLIYTASGATYRAVDHEFFSIDGLTQFAKFGSTGLSNLNGNISLNQGNQTNVPVLDATNVGPGVTGLNISWQGGGGLLFGGTTGSRAHMSLANRSMLMEIDNNGSDGGSIDALTISQKNVVARNVLGLTNYASGTGDFIRADTAGTAKFRVDSSGNVWPAGNVRLPNAKGYQWTDFSGTVPNFTLQGDNNLILYGTDGVGAQRAIFGNLQRSSTSRFEYYVPVTLGASAAAASPFRIPHGTAPSSPVDGDVWTTTAGLFVRVNGVTVGPLAAAGAGLSALTMNNGGAGAASGTTFDGTVARTISYNTIGAVPTGAVTTSGLTMATARLLGRTTAATGAIEEITAGATLSLTGGSLGVASSVALAGSPTTTTQSENTNNTTIATTAYVDRLKGLVFSSGAGTTLTTAHRGGLFSTTAAVTAPNSVFAAGDVITIYNNSASAVTLTQGAGVTMRLSGTATTGSRTLAQRGLATITYVSASECVVAGDVS